MPDDPSSLPQVLKDSCLFLDRVCLSHQLRANQLERQSEADISIRMVTAAAA